MSWLYSQVLVEGFLEENSLDGEQYAQLSGNHTQQAYCSPDRMTVCSRLSRFGMTFKPLTVSLGEDLLMWYLADFRARTLVQQDEEPESKEKKAQCGNTWRESSVRFDLNTLSWKTHQCLFAEDLAPSSVILPRWGMMRDGECFQQHPLEPITKGIGFGLLLPTPTCHNAKEGNYPAEMKRNTPLLATHVGGKIHPEFTEWMMGFPPGWTDLKPSETDKSPCARQQHGNR
jgi:hypothetical protein